MSRAHERWRAGEGCDRAGEEHPGHREPGLSGPVTIDDHSARGKDGVGVDLLTTAGKKVGSLLATGTFFEDVSRVGNYRIRVSWSSDAFEPFFVTDPRDGNSVFHPDGIEKITGIAIAIATK
ncbi:hypothetical protein QT381_04050 [Galbitalea sp. SE-J8]|uniref:hypothetical protein n=1 Tax=Galbitalea sp. SE-J8 TaxID=3054952 RepID=UPI00259D25E5|nr:hypothetical protein [Galbitalea sp. SE-J8]MDM4762177.1 hypothetical protein [Galbitalea sp. SE-J8]